MTTHSCYRDGRCAWGWLAVEMDLCTGRALLHWGWLTVAMGSCTGDAYTGDARTEMSALETADDGDAFLH